MARAIVVGAGISGAACAAQLRAAGVDVTVLDRGRAPGGRLASPTIADRPVDLGAAYLTARDADFGAVVGSWHERGLLRPWTDTLDVLDGSGARTSSGPQRWAAPGGLRSLARDLLDGQVVEQGRAVESVAVADGRPCVDGVPADAVVLAMPDPQARRLVGDLPGVDWVPYDPVVAVAAGWASRAWTLRDAAFVNDHLDLSLVADDGARRGDGAPVLVAHTTPDRARRHLDDPQGAIPYVLAALRSRLGVATAPEWSHAHRWTFAKPAGTHGDAPFHLTDEGIGLAGDSWCAQGAPRVESAWLSGHRLGAALADRLA